MFAKILVADRGEIALRVIRACQEMDIETVAVHSEADTNSMHVRLADEDVCIGPPAGEASYRNFANIISAAELTNADAIHPGYGPLAENADFAELCQSCGIKFIGPPVEAIRKMGDKAMARQSVEQAGVPVIPGSEGELASLAGFEIHQPVILAPVVAQQQDKLVASWHEAIALAAAQDRELGHRNRGLVRSNRFQRIGSRLDRGRIHD